VVQQDLTRAPASQRYFVVFSSTAFVRAREGVGRLLATREVKTAFDPAALRPVLPVAATEADFERWVWPLRVDTSTECQAPLEIAP
jgi:hypothetical protein